MRPILEVRGLSRTYGPGCPSCVDATGPSHQRNVCPHCGSVVAVHDVSFTLMPGEILGIMGESGSGKSTVVKLLNFDEAPTSGTAMFFDGQKEWDLFALNAAEKRWLRDNRMGTVYQNPHLGLNLDISAGGNIAERLLMSDVLSYAEIRERARGLLARTQVPALRMDERPRRFSGGMQQRVQIARALVTNPPLLLLDEVTTGLDLSVQARILDLILELQERLGIAMIAVTHDLGVIRLLASRTIVMRYGHIVECGLTDQILEDPQHAYTQELVAAAL
ncbi:MAG: ATP-binding cassette domain-containing protein [Alphaproteobacteria bacterium]|nr:ATP-binding cassette domain-containing protein [Alphaproteobacteria bacterium]